MIKTFKNSDSEKIFHNLFAKQFSGIQRQAQRKLKMLHAAVDLRDLESPPGNKLEVLRGDRKGQYSIRVNDQWRVCFRWENGFKYDVEIVDYH